MRIHFELSKDEIASAVLKSVRESGPNQIQLSSEAKVRFTCRFLDDKITSLTADVTDGPETALPIVAAPGGAKTNETTVTST